MIRAFRRLPRDERATSAVEFALVSVPLIFILMMIMQMGLYYMTKSSLDAGMIQAADALVCSFNANTNGTTTTSSIAIPSACSTAASNLAGASIKTLVVATSGGMIHNNATLAVDLRQLANLTAAVVPVVDQQVDNSQPNATGHSLSIMVLRAESQIPWFMPWIGIGALGGSCAGASGVPCVRSSAIIRRQN